MTVNRSKPDQFLLRLPPGLRDRVKRYADKKNRSINEQIVRILEREFPEPWTVEERVNRLLGLMAMLKEADSNEQIDTLNEALEETMAAIASGRMSGVDDETRRRIEERFDEWKVGDVADKYHAATDTLDDEEIESMNRGHGTGKF